MTSPDRACLSYWFPRLLAAGLPVPETQIIETNVPLYLLLDGKTPPGLGGFLKVLRKAATAVGYPVFLRTGHGSGKHQWKDTCYVTTAQQLRSHVRALVEWSETVDMMGLPYQTWAVRELLPTRPLAILPDYGDFPLVREFRGFVKDGAVACVHPYWPEDAIRRGFPPVPFEALASPEMDEAAREADARHDVVRHLPEDFEMVVEWVQRYDGADPDHDAAAKAVVPLLARVAEAFASDGAWSVDVLETERGWYVTDCAPAERSFHWPDCDVAKREGWMV